MTFKLRATSPPWEDPGRWLLVEEVGRAGALRWRFDKRLLAAEGAGHMHDILRGVWTLSTCSGVIRPVRPPTPLTAPGDGKAGESTFPSDSDMHLVDSCLLTRGPWQTARASRKQSSLSGKESAQGCIPKRLLGRPD